MYLYKQNYNNIISLETILNDFFKNLMTEQEGDIPQIPIREILPTDRIAKAVLTLVLVKKYKDDMLSSMDYKSFDGSKLPYPSGCNLVNAMTTYIDHGGDKTEAIEKFIDEHLRDYGKLEELLEYVGEALDKKNEK